MDRIARLVDVIKKLINGEFTGYIKINFSQGNIGRVEKFEEIDDAAVIGTKSERMMKEDKDHL